MLCLARPSASRVYSRLRASGREGFTDAEPQFPDCASMTRHPDKTRVLESSRAAICGINEGGRSGSSRVAERENRSLLPRVGQGNLYAAKVPICSGARNGSFRKRISDGLGRRSHATCSKTISSRRPSWRKSLEYRDGAVGTTQKTPNGIADARQKSTKSCRSSGTSIRFRPHPRSVLVN